MTDLAESLNRTLLLMRDEVHADAHDGILLDALTGTRIALIADDSNIASNSAQTALITAANLMARSGHRVFLLAPNIVMSAPQPPLGSGRLIDQLLILGKDLLPGIEFAAHAPDEEIDLAIALGDSPINLRARRRIWLNAERWAGSITRESQRRLWCTDDWPFGALAAAALGAGEAFKAAIHKLLPYAIDRSSTADRFANTDEIQFNLAPTDAPLCQDLGQIDCVSGGAITHAVLYCLARIPAVKGWGRIIEPDTADLSNLNRYSLLLRSSRHTTKAPDLVRRLDGILNLTAVGLRFEPATLYRIAPLAPRVIVGVDHIPTRWAVQRANPDWLAIGATTHWSAMASFHSEGLACAQCLHNQDDSGDALIPTTACVSFWAGLLTAAYVARHAAQNVIGADVQQIYMTPFRPENPFPSAVAVRGECPTCQPIVNACS